MEKPSDEVSKVGTLSSSKFQNIIITFTSIGTMTPLAHDFVPGPNDVICCRGQTARKHQGNINFRKIVHDKINDYSNAISKLGKSLIVKGIVDKVRKSSPEGGFVKEKDGKWYEVGDHLAREKVGQSLRDSLHSKYRSSSTSKKRRRIEQQAKLDDRLETIIESHCNQVLDGMKNISLRPNNENEIQTLLNNANSKLLRVLKENDQNDKKIRDSVENISFKRKTSNIQSKKRLCVEDLSLKHASSDVQSKRRVSIESSSIQRTPSDTQNS